MRVVVNHNLCEGNGRCSQTAPEVFELRDDDYSYVRIEKPPPELNAKIELAARRCPRQAILLLDD